MHEIERKFLTTSFHLAIVRADEVSPDYSHRLWLNALGATSIEIAHIHQVYLEIEQDTQGEIVREERIRRKIVVDEKGVPINRLYYYTSKRGRGECRGEREIPICEDDFKSLIHNQPYQKPHLDKIRTSFDLRGERIEIDRYLGNLGGLCTSEIEFADIGAAANFEPEAFRDILNEELTGRGEFYGARLALADSIPSSITLPKYLAA